jgi:ATP-dependent helicase/nuclease subunit A
VKKNLVKMISASAGSGKTYRLMELVHEEVSSGLKARGLIAVTYTKKAAEELKQRIREKLVESGRIDSARSMAAARIGTVHSVCADLLKRFSFEDGSSPRQKVIDEVEAARLFDSSLNEILSQSHLSKLSSIGYKLSLDVPSIIGQVRGLAVLIRQNDISESGITDSVQHSLNQMDFVFDKPKASSTQKNLVDQLNSYLSSHAEPPDTTKKTGDAHKVIQNIRSTAVDQGRDLPWSEWVRLTKLSPGVKSEDFYKDIMDCARGFMSSSELRADLRIETEIVFELASEAMKAYGIKKRNLGVLDYGDLEIKTLHLLDQSKVRDQLAAEIEVLFVDEFQDTNPVQLAIFLKLSALCKKTVWVGDLKQSIYRFRGADPILMKSIAKEISDSNAEVLKDNWRSTPQIISFVNDLFGEAFKVDGIVKDQVVQKPQWKHAVNSEGLDVWDGSGKNKGERVQKFAYGLSTFLKEDIKVIDRETELPRAIRAGDVAILCRSNDECVDISSTLKAYDIESSVVGGQLLDQPEVTLALAAYRYLMSPRDTVAAAELALGLGVTANDWLQQAVDSTEPDQWHPALLRITQARSQIAEMSIREKLDLAIAAIPLESWIQRLDEGDKRLFHLSALRQEAKKFESTCQASFLPCTDMGFLEYIDKMNPPVPSSNHSDAVHIITYHSSKGLEWPVVIMASLEQSSHDVSLFGSRVELKSGAKFDPSKPLENRIISYMAWPFGNYSSIPEVDLKSSQSDILKRLKDEAQSEQRRILYVGMTRARERLVFLNNLGKTEIAESILGVLSGEGGCLLSFPTTEPTLKVGGKSHPCGRRALGIPPEDLGETKKFKAVKKKTIALPDGKPELSMTRPLFFQPSRLSKENAPALIYGIGLGRSTNWGPHLLLKNGARKADSDKLSREDRSDVIGSAVHLFLGSDVYSESKEKRLAIAHDITKTWGITNSVEASDLLASSDRFYSLIQKLWPNSKIYREVPMELELDGSLIRGSIDCLVVSETDVAIIDHKTSESSFEEFLELGQRYQLQLAAYAEATRRQFASKSISTWLHNPNGWMGEVIMNDNAAGGTT